MSRQRLSPAEKRFCEFALDEFPDLAPPLRYRLYRQAQGYAVAVCWVLAACGAIRLEEDVFGSPLALCAFVAALVGCLRTAPRAAWFGLILTMGGTALYLKSGELGRLLGFGVAQCIVFLFWPRTDAGGGPYQKVSRCIRTAARMYRRASSSSSGNVRPSLSRSTISL